MNILNTILPEKRVFKCAIRAIYGIGLTRSLRLSQLLGLHHTTRIEQVSKIKIKKITAFIERTFIIDFELKRIKDSNLSLLHKMHTFRGSRHFFGLPSRGQRTHTNASTARKLLGKKKLFDRERERDKNRGFKRKKTPHVRMKHIKKALKKAKKQSKLNKK